MTVSMANTMNSASLAQGHQLESERHFQRAVLQEELTPTVLSVVARQPQCLPLLSQGDFDLHRPAENDKQCRDEGRQANPRPSPWINNRRCWMLARVELAPVEWHGIPTLDRFCVPRNRRQENGNVEFQSRSGWAERTEPP